MSDKIRQYLIKYAKEEERHLPQLNTHNEIVNAYDINEALIQFGVKYKGSVAIVEIMPVTIIDESKPEKVEDKKEVHVKPNPVKKEDDFGKDLTTRRDGGIVMAPWPKSPDTD